MAKSRFMLHYGGQQFEVNDDEVLDGIAGDTTVGTIKFRLADDRWLTIATGPGIPVAIEEIHPGDTRQSTGQVARRIR